MKSKYNNTGFTLVELMIVVAVLGLLAAIAMPNFVRARTNSQTNACIHNLRQIDSAAQTWALENNRTSSDTYTLDIIKPYLKLDSRGEIPGCAAPTGGGNALLKRGEPITADIQRMNIRAAARALAPLAQDHELVLSNGNGPQVGLLALQAAAYNREDPYPLDVLDAHTEGMIGYMIEQELRNLLPRDVPFAPLLTMIEVDPADPAFLQPDKFVGPQYSKSDADRIIAEKGWFFKKDGDMRRRVVPSPLPKRIFEIRTIEWPPGQGAIVICTGGGGIPVTYERDGDRHLVGVEAVIDKDFASSDC